VTAQSPEPQEPLQQLEDEPLETEPLETEPLETEPLEDELVETEPLEEESTRLTRELAERTSDLQRLQAEYVNYKRRVDRDRVVAREQAMTGALSALLPVLDDLDRARQHDQLTGGFKAVAESLERIVSGLGLVRFGEAGEEFDPRVHEALMHDYSAEVSVPTAHTILQPGYRVGERVVRPARVAVVEPSPSVPETPDEAEDAPDAGPDSGPDSGPDTGPDTEGREEQHG